MNLRANRSLLAAAIACIVIGTALSHCVEPGVRVKPVNLAWDTPALQFTPAGSGPHPVALLAHGVTASKETLFRIAEALSAAGFICYAVDLPGHGQSRQIFGHNLSANHRTLEQVARSIGPVDVFVGHSMGAYAGDAAVNDGGVKVRLFIAIGADPDLGDHGPPLLILSGQLDEAIPQHFLKERTDARVQFFSECDHALEPYDPRLVNAAVDAACATVGKPPPPRPTRWVLRVLGATIGLFGALGLLLLLPKLPPPYAFLRGPIVAAIFVAALILTTGTWLDATPHLRRALQQIPLILMAVLVVAGAGRLRIPRWSFSTLAALGWIGCLLLGIYFLGLIIMLGAIVLFAGAVLGWIASRHGSRLDGDLAMGIFVGYAVGQCFPLIF